MTAHEERTEKGESDGYQPCVFRCGCFCRFTLQEPTGATRPVSIQKSPGEVVAEVAVLDADASKVLSALKSGLEGKALPEQAEGKLSVMDPNRMRLLLQLSDRVLDRDHPTGSRLALLLMTMLLILS